MDFEQRRLHGKAYWTTSDSSWLLLGSPNLSRQGLLQTASAANTETALMISPDEPPLGDRPGSLGVTSPWRRQPQSLRRGPGRDRCSRGSSSFNAWEDDTIIRVEGVKDGTVSDYWATAAGTPWEQ